MRIKRKTLAIALLLSVAATFSGATTLQVLVESQSPAGCHGHGRPTRSPEPQSHLCCEAGHQTAILQSSVRVGDSANFVSRIPDFLELLSTQDCVLNFSSGMVFLGSPPANPQLRV
jgi:hypothetical protein